MSSSASPESSIHEDQTKSASTPATSARSSDMGDEKVELIGEKTVHESSVPSSSSDPEIIIIGAGIAGSALAYSLSASGRSVLLIERDLSPPDRIVGELLQPGGVDALRRLGMRECLDNIDATPVEGYCVVMGDREVGIPYPNLVAVEEGKSVKEVVETSASGKVEGRSFHHGRFIDQLRRKVKKDGTNVRVLEGTVKDLITCEHTTRVVGVSVSIKSGKDAAGVTITETKNFYAPLTIIADGCFSKFRSAPSASSSSVKSPTPIATIKTRSHFVGLVLQDVPLPRPRHGTVCLTPNGPVLLYQIADRAGETRMLVDVKGKLPSVGDGSLKTHIEKSYLPHLPASFHPSILSAMEKDRLRVMPNSFLPPKMQGRRGGREGVIMVGDSWNMRHPLTGGGMTVALHDAVLLTEHLKPSRELEDLGDWETIRLRLQEWHWERKHLAGVVNVLSMALYDLFGADDPDLEVLRDGCFKYFELGGECVQGPVGLLSALTPKPLLLLYHFFAVALYSLYLLFTQPRKGQKYAPGMADYPGLVAQSGRVFWTACVVILPVVWTELRA